MKKVYIIHCWGGTPKDGWYPWICNHLQKNEIEVKCLEMPNTNAPKIEEWIVKMEQEIKFLDEDTFFIGHSIGCQTIMRYLQRKKITKIGGILFVAPWLELSLKAIESEEDYNIAKPWLEEPLFLEKIKKCTENITCIFSDDDYFVPLSQKRIFESKLSAHCIVVHKKGHISEEDGVFELKEILLATFKMLGLEILEIVDETGKFTKEILEKELAHDKNLLHNEIVVLIVNDKKEILLQKRSPKKRFKPNKWGFCAGHVDAYETLDEAALREMHEEVGLIVEKEDLHPFYRREINKKSINSNIQYYYYVKTNLKEEAFTIQKEEVSEVKWVALETIKKWLEEGKTSFDNFKVFEEIQKVLEREN